MVYIHTKGVIKQKITLAGLLLLAGLFAFLSTFGILGKTNASSDLVIYNAISEPLPSNVPSLGFQATSTSEFGDKITLGGTNRDLKSITVTMSNWALYSDYSADIRYSNDNTNWTHPITLNIYGTTLDTNGIPNNLIATKTITASIPWRPAEDPVSCPTKDSPGYAYKYQAVPGPTDTNCYNGFAFNLPVDFSELSITLPNEIIVSVAYNTQTYGLNPIGIAGPYNSLNVGIPTNQTVTVGTDADTDKTFWNTTFPGYTAGLKEDSGWSPNGTVSFKIDTIDTTAPDVPTQISPASGTATTTAGLTKIDWSDVTDPSSPVTYYYQSSLSSSTNGDGSFASPVYSSGALNVSEIPTPGTPEGVYYWHVRAVDSVGNSSAWSTPWIVSVDNTKPTASFIKPLGEAYKNSVDVQFSMSDSGSGLKNMVVNIYNSSNTLLGTCGIAPNLRGVTENTINCRIDTTSYIEGVYTLKGGGFDQAGNNRTITTSFVVDKTRPNLVFITPSAGDILSGTATVQIEATDAFGIKVMAVNLYDDMGNFLAPCGSNPNVGGISPASFTCEIDTTKWIDGSYVLKAGTFDVAGNNKTITRSVVFQNLVILTDKNQCKYGGWETSDIPIFRNQGDCVSHFSSTTQMLRNPDLKVDNLRVR